MSARPSGPNFCFGNASMPSSKPCCKPFSMPTRSNIGVSPRKEEGHALLEVSIQRFFPRTIKAGPEFPSGLSAAVCSLLRVTFRHGNCRNNLASPLRLGILAAAVETRSPIALTEGLSGFLEKIRCDEHTVSLNLIGGFETTVIGRNLTRTRRRRTVASGLASGATLRHLRDLFRGGTAAGLTDGQLLARYAANHDGFAFAALLA